MTPITGNTYPVRRELRALGGQWNANQQAWLVPTDRAAEARGWLEVGKARKNGSRVKRAVKTALTSLALAGSAFAWQPTQADIQSALTRAAGAWGVRAEVAEIRLSRLNDCRIGIDPAALTVFATRTITINTACQWSPKMLQVAVEHEYGHMIFGNDWHSEDRRSVMYSRLGTRRVVTAGDREALRGAK